MAAVKILKSDHARYLGAEKWFLHPTLVVRKYEIRVHIMRLGLVRLSLFCQERFLTSFISPKITLGFDAKRPANSPQNAAN